MKTFDQLTTGDTVYFYSYNGGQYTIRPLEIDWIAHPENVYDGIFIQFKGTSLYNRHLPKNSDTFICHDWGIYSTNKQLLPLLNLAFNNGVAYYQRKIREALGIEG